MKSSLVREKMEKFGVVRHLNGYPCSWMKMGSSNVSLMWASRVSRSVSRERCPVISASNHLMGTVNLNKMDMHCAISGFRRWSEWLALVKRKKIKTAEGKSNLKKRGGCKEQKKQFLPSMVCVLFVLQKCRDSDRNFNYLITAKWKDINVVISAVFHRSI